MKPHHVPLTYGNRLAPKSQSQLFVIDEGLEFLETAEDNCLSVHGTSLEPHENEDSLTMPGHRRVKDVGYDDDDVDDYYSDEDGDYAAGGDGGDEYTAEDRENFATLTPVVKAELQEAGLQASDREVEDALWNYYWDVGKSVNYLKNAKQPKTQPIKTAPKEKAKSKFDEAQERSKAMAGGECIRSLLCLPTTGKDLAGLPI